jgi:hypothetical protein
LTVSRTLATESELKDPARIEYLYAIVVAIRYLKIIGIGDVDISPATDRDTVGEIELTVPRTLATESEGKISGGGARRDTNTSDRCRRDERKGFQESF